MSIHSMKECIKTRQQILLCSNVIRMDLKNIVISIQKSSHNSKRSQSLPKFQQMIALDVMWLLPNVSLAIVEVELTAFQQTNVLKDAHQLAPSTNVAGNLEHLRVFKMTLVHRPSPSVSKHASLSNMANAISSSTTASNVLKDLLTQIVFTLWTTAMQPKEKESVSKIN